MDITLINAVLAVLLFVSSNYVLLFSWQGGWKKNGSGYKARRLPPGPPIWPILGNLPCVWGSGKLEEKLSHLSKKYGPLMWLQLGARSTLVVNSPAMAKAILVDQDLLFADRPPPTYGFKKLMHVGMDLFTPLDKPWKLEKSIGVGEFMSPKMVTERAGERKEELSACLSFLAHMVMAAEREGSPQAPAVPFRAIMLGLFMNLQSRATYGRRFCTMLDAASPSIEFLERLQEWCESYEVLIGGLVRLLGEYVVEDVFPALAPLDCILSYSTRRRVTDYLARADAVLKPIVEERRQEFLTGVSPCHLSSNGPQTLMDALLSGRYSNGKEPSPHLVQVCMHSMMIGAENPPWALEWTLMELMASPKHLRAVQEELDRVVGRSRQVQEEDIPKLPILRAVLMEACRMHPPASFTLPHCNSKQDAQVAGYHIPKGTSVLVNIYGICNNPEVWPEPRVFKPERFLARPDLALRGYHLELPMFSSGRRRCPATNLMDSILHLTLARCLHSFNWDLPHGSQVDFSPYPGWPTWANTPLMLIPSFRLSPHLL